MPAQHRLTFICAALLVAACGASQQQTGRSIERGRTNGVVATTNVLQHHNNPSKDGLYIDPLITEAAAANARLDASLDVALSGQVYSQPLYVQNGPDGRPILIIGTENNAVVAVDARDGTRVWENDLEPPALRAQYACGNISLTIGVTGTPVIDLDARVVYVAADTTQDSAPHHKVFALSLDDGTTLPGWPVDLNSTVSFGVLPFNSGVQNQRGGLLLNQGYLYVPYGGHFGDCGSYRGWVVAIPVNDPSNPLAFATDLTFRGSGIWGPAGLATDGTSVFATTGNTFGLPPNWAGGEAVFRLGAGATFSGDVADHFFPSNWRALDAGDADVGGVAPILVDVPGANPSALVVAIGKNGVAYLLDRNFLGGMGTGDGVHGEGVYSERVATNSNNLINAPAAFTASSGTYVVVASSSNGVGCPATPGPFIAFKIGASMPPTINVAWCASGTGRGSPIVTTTDGSSEPVVWTIVPGVNSRLRAYNGETGELLSDVAGPSLVNVRNFQTPIALNGRIFVAGDNRLFAFTTQ